MANITEMVREQVEASKKTSRRNIGLVIVVKDSEGNTLGTIPAGYRRYSSGSYGYFANGKLSGIDPHDTLQVSGNFVICGSKDPNWEGHE